ncbi:MAG TPA: cation:proton antiporter [Bacteriovoracaceae bacterium]|nr:cation:proton antiporter [Bacteriovoracaceae bacterium]
MSQFDFNQFLITSALALGLANVLGHLFTKVKQPRVMAEIGVGILLGPSLLGHFYPEWKDWLFPKSLEISFGLLKELGLILLMFCSGAELRHLDPRHHKKECFYGVLLGIGIPAVIGGFILTLVDVSSLAGSLGDLKKLNSILILSMAVTSIPVISRILLDLNLLKTKFAEKVLSIALIEDFLLYAFLNAIMSTESGVEVSSVSIVGHLLVSGAFLSAVIFFRVQLFGFFRTLAKAVTNNDSIHLYVTYTLSVLFLVIWLSGHLGIVSMISAFCAGMILGSGTSERVEVVIESIRQLAFSFFIPFYFIMVGYRIDLQKDLSLRWFFLFFFLSSSLKILGGFLTGRLTQHTRIQSIALGITLNARGGPGIVIASAAFDSNIINSTLFTTLIITALATSSLAGTFLDKNRKIVVDQG